MPRSSSSSSEEEFDYFTEDDMYHVYLLEKLDKINDNKYTKRIGIKCMN